MSNQILADLKQLLTDIKNKKYDRLLDHSKPNAVLHEKLAAELAAIQKLEKENFVFSEQHHLIYAFCLLDTINQQHPGLKPIKHALEDAKHALTDAIDTNEDYQLFAKQFINADLLKKSQETVDAILKTAQNLNAGIQPGLTNK